MYDVGVVCVWCVRCVVCGVDKGIVCVWYIVCYDMCVVWSVVHVMWHV